MKYLFLSILTLLSLSSAFAQKTTVYCNEQLELIDLETLQYSGDSIAAKFDAMGLNMYATIKTSAIFERNDTTFHIVGLSLSGSMIDTTFATQTFPETGDDLRLFELTTIDGTILRSKDLAGKIIFLNFWFTTCPPCIAEIPALEQLRKDYKDKGVVFAALSTDPKELIVEFLADRDWNYQQLPDASTYTEQYTVGYPVNMLIDRNGKIVMKTGSFSSLTVKDDETPIYEENTELVRLLLEQLLAH